MMLQQCPSFRTLHSQSPSPSGNLYSLQEEVFWALREVNYNYHVLKLKPRTATCYKQFCERGKRQVCGGDAYRGLVGKETTCKNLGEDGRITLKHIFKKLA